MEILASLLSGLKAVCAAFPDPRKGRIGNIAMADFGLSAFGHVFHAERVFSVLSAEAGEGPGTVELPNPVWDREDPFRQLYQGHARRRGSHAARALLSTHGATAP